MPVGALRHDPTGAQTMLVNHERITSASTNQENCPRQSATTPRYRQLNSKLRYESRRDAKSISEITLPAPIRWLELLPAKRFFNSSVAFAYLMVRRPVRE